MNHPKFICVLLLVLCNLLSIVNGLEEAECVQGETRQEKCNTCLCVETNTWICTKKFCVNSRETRDIPISADLKNTPCAPNDYFKLDCNTCYCNLDKSGYLCTENICPVGTPDLTTSAVTGGATSETTTISNDPVSGIPSTTQSLL